MSEAKEQKIYVPKSSAKVVEFKSGKKILKISFKSAEMIEFIKQYTNSKGYINLGVSRRKEVSQYGDTHCIWLDTWEPGQRSAQPTQQKPTESSPDPEEEKVQF